jgi:UDP-N-acetylmuramoyl-L-alanyl-D-glutamate--2,6-diaminopimelate ligase
MKKLNDVIKNILIKQIIGDINISIKNISIDSRIINSNDMFIALQGYSQDGHDFIKEVISKNVKCILCKKIPKILCYNVTYIIMHNIKNNLQKLCCNLYVNPTNKIQIIGVTGTNGKTTIATLLYELFTKSNQKSALFSTIHIIIDKLKIYATNTTPNIVELYKYINQSIKKKCKYIFMEISSHAIYEKRILGIRFNGMIYTNLSHDHLDFHKCFSNYLHTKKQVFNNLSKNAFAIINVDDKYYQSLIDKCQAVIKTYSLKKKSNYHLKIIQQTKQGTIITINNHLLHTLLIGEFNMYNLLAIYSTAIELKLNIKQLNENIKYLKNIEGRFEIISYNELNIIIDYAHNPIALKNIFYNINKLYNKPIICVLGCGGNRDVEKRPVMTNIAYKLSHILILTSDNPRFENQNKIIQDMLKGISTPSNNLFIINNRKKAIKKSIQLASKKNIVLIVGKGHEKFQEINGEKIKFNDKKVANYYIKEINNRC